MPKRWTDDDLEWAKDLRAQGYDCDAIAKAMGGGRTGATVIKMLGRAGIKIEEPSRQRKQPQPSRPSAQTLLRPRIVTDCLRVAARRRTPRGPTF